MPPRRDSPSLNSLSPQDAPVHPASMPSSPAHIQFPQGRSNSPSGLAHLLSKPSRWFRKPSDPRLAWGSSEPRSSTSSSSLSVRKPKISRPTDPRPIFQSTFQSEPRVSDASKSVLDLSSQLDKSFDLQRPFPTSQPSSPLDGSLGDLRSISRKTWSKSADDLGNISISYSSADISFQHRVQEYRNRSNSSATLHPASSSSGPGSPIKHPFPTIVTNIPPSSSPPDGGFTSPDPGISINVSSPTSDTFSAAPEELPSVHHRNTSFAPRLPSKLSASKLGFTPSSPKRKGSGSERDAELTKDKDNDRSGPSGTRGVFPFSLASPSNKHSTPNPTSLTSQNTTPSPSSLLAPAMLEPRRNADSRESRRTSQIVYNSGFINRMGDAAPSIYAHYRPYSSATNLTLSKGWKAFKAELKGSKLYFYKPPNDRGAAIKELFPTEIVPAFEDNEADGEADALEDPRFGRSRDDGTAGRKKRAYWSRKTHPDLAHGDSGIEKGTFEALLHEAVFATTFLQPATEDGRQSVSTGEPRQPQWKEFSSAILLCLPILVGREKFENEFTRLCDNLVGGADMNRRDFERSCISWMADEYLRYHGTPADEPGWNDWQKETIPKFSWNEGSTSGISKSTSTQAIFTPSPNPTVPSPSLAGSTFSPNLGTFSPRPVDDAKMASLMEALGPVGLQGTASPVKPLSPRQQRVWALLAKDGFTREVLSLLDPSDIAHSLGVFHQRILQKLPVDLRADHILKTDGSSGASPDLGARGSSPSAALPLFGSEDRPHWLTRLLLMQILGADSSNSSGEERSASSRTHSRSEVISMWARIGEFCRVEGDECSWMAISAALFSRPVARLSKAWRRVDRQSNMAVESWIYPGGDGQVALVGEPIMTPWGGDVKDRAKHLLERARDERTDEVWAAKYLMQTRDLFEGLRTKVSLCPRNTATEELPPDVEKLLTFWQDFVEEKGNQNFLASKFQRVDQFMSLSLAAEPRRKGLFEPFFWSHSMSTPHILCHPLTPLLFVEPLPAVTLLDRGQIWRGRLESGPTKLSVEELQRLRGLDIALIPASRGNRSDASSSKDKLFNIGDVDIRETAIPVYDGELLLMARSELDPLSSSRPPSRAPSRPPSSVAEGCNPEKPMTRSPSIRVKPGSSQGLERKSSVARRSSLPSISSRPNAMLTEVSSERPIRVIVQAGTLDRLVNVLIHGLQGVSVAVADDNGETSLRDSKTRDLVVDRAEFARVWWHVFRSFVTPFVFFELLRKRFLGSRPSTPPSSSSSLLVIQFRMEVLEMIKDWITSGGGAQDCLDNIQLFEAVQSFLESPLDRSSFDPLSTEENDVSQTWDALDSARQMTFTAFKAHTQRPPSVFLANARPLNPSTRARSFGNQPPDLDEISAEELVENLNAMGCAAFSNISEEDLFITADLLEVQSADSTGWFSTRDVQSTDDIDIQSIYSHIMEVQPSSLISELSQDNFYRVLPPSIRSCIRAFNILRKWTISKLIAPKLGIRIRQARMDLFLRAIEIARLRSMDAGSTSFGNRACVRSFVEAVLSSAVISSESRMHHRPWQNIANIRGVQCESLAALLSRPTVFKKSYGEPLAIDISWILERILELVTIPNVVTTSGEGDMSVINMDKRRHLCNLILNTPSLASKRERPRDTVDRKDFERLNNVEREVDLILFDHRGIRDEAQREALQTQGNGLASARKAVRPFQRLVALQQDKYKRDRYLYDRLSKDKKQEQLRNERRDDQINKAMRARKPMTQVQKQHRMKKSYSSAFFQLMRPISSAFLDSTHATALKRSPAELDFMPSGKPSLVLSVVDARVAQFINNERSFTFQLDTEDGGHYLLQAMSKQEMVRWIEQINRIAKLAAKRRLTYLGNSPKPQLADHIHDHPSGTTASRDPRAVFGVDLEFLLQREANGAQPEIGAIPSVIQACLSEVESRGLDEVGIYRIAGATSEVNALRDAFNRGELPITPNNDIHAVCDLVKSWFRLLPEPVFPSSSYFGIIDAMKLEDLNSRLSCIRSVVHGLPQANFDLLKRVAEHLDRVTDYEEHNQMTAEALAIVFSPNLLRAPQNDFALILSNMGHTHKLVKALITHFHVIFDDELEADHDVEEDEIEEPILEEDEEEEIRPTPGDES